MGDGKARWLAGVLAACLAGIGCLAGTAAAQVYDVPTFRTPYGETGLGLHLVLQNDADDVGVLGTWRRSGSDIVLGVRAGLLEADGDLGLMVGMEVGRQFVQANEEFPLDVAWASGVGVGTVPDRDVTLLRVPIGISIGRRVQLDDGGTFITPYAHPRLAVDILFFDAGPGEDDTRSELNADIDLGLDIELSPQVTFRFAVTVGENEAIGLGLAF